MMRISMGVRPVCRKALKADGFWLRFSGLQLRVRWPGNCDGIWFPQCRAVHTFFTFLEPDILFLDRRGRVLDIRAHVPAWLLLMGPKGSTDTLEVPGGTARRLKIRNGTVLRTT